MNLQTAPQRLPVHPTFGFFDNPLKPLFHSAGDFLVQPRGGSVRGGARQTFPARSSNGVKGGRALGGKWGHRKRLRARLHAVAERSILAACRGPGFTNSPCACPASVRCATPGRVRQCAKPVCRCSRNPAHGAGVVPCPFLRANPCAGLAPRRTASWTLHWQRCPTPTLGRNWCWSSSLRSIQAGHAAWRF